MPNFFKSLFGIPSRKPESVPYQGIKSLEEIPQTKPYTEELMRRMYQGPEYWREKFYEDIYQPTAAQERGTWGERVQQPIMETAGAMGMARSTPTIDRLAQELTKREMGLAVMAGELRGRGMEFGKGMSESARAGLGQYIDSEGNVRYRAGMADLQAAQANEQAITGFNQRVEQAIPMAVGGALTTAGSIYGMANPAPSYMDLLIGNQMQAGAQERSPFMLRPSPMNANRYMTGRQAKKNYGFNYLNV